MKKFLVFILIFILSFQSVLAFTPGFIISDFEFNDFNSMDLYDIQYFLKKKKSFLANFKYKNKTAAQIIYEASQKYKINPKVLLTTLQKEQSLIQGRKKPKQYNLDWAMGFGMCDSCTRFTKGIEKFKGFQKQIELGAKRLKEYIQNSNSFTFKQGLMYQIDKKDVMILNKATAALYNYTPHINGNKNFWKIWQRWFVKHIPNGSIVKTPNDPTIWLIKYGMKRKIKNMSVLLSKYDPKKIIIVSPDDLDKYEQGPEIKFPQYSLLKGPTGKKYLLVDEDILRPIESDKVFRKLGFNPVELIPISEQDLKDFNIGEPITMKSIYPLGALLQNKKTGGVYFVKDGKKHPLLAKELLITNFKNYKIIPTDPNELKEYKTAEPIKFKDGELVKAYNKPTVYIIDEGEKRPFINAESFIKAGFKWENIIETNNKILNLHPTGKPIDYK